MGVAAVSQTAPIPKVATPETLTASIKPAVLNFDTDGQTAGPDINEVQREQSYYSRPGEGAASSKECKMLNNR